MRNDIQNLGIILIDVGNTQLIQPDDVFCQAYIYMINFIRRNFWDVNRVIKIDLYDTVFQGDPFTQSLPKGAVHLLEEGLSFLSSEGNVNMDLLNALGYKVQDFNYHYVCAGYFGGDVEEILNFLSFSLTFYLFGRHWHDQALFNYLLMTGIYENNHIFIKKYDSLSLVRHLSGIKLRDNQFLGNVTSAYRNDRYAAIIHHYYLGKDFLYSIYRSCPPTSIKYPDYINIKMENLTFEEFERKAKNL
ncbi:hypothetical protein TVAG_316040 [Trichomonas vaginalis G3]|uniref:Uncharacterized protein n=1 Tax=Trichomonas vaginalis (strain ATCC PRA-98 / G3) TaxID=412133 RepID=A2FAW2_TRIV3|nr:hypothetical protein TVAGG3_0888260 [Trichomonas vaginalis G3]EAX97939.1 hypothetical protein TVAG_316040 [Trichomonas vaginalis G3]KAI5502535.1 hypothetical protein TVAGG3_0888260 [Trichomonas vaginalis G3]|eukprot:XP_001310869.1 hypothetical protein [Trichomonas vaginalis G3]